MLTEHNPGAPAASTSRGWQISLKDSALRIGIWTVLLALSAALVWTSLWRFKGDREHLPAGCDEFGYLYQADAITRARLFCDHTHRPFLKDLVAHLDTLTDDPDHYRWTLAPHAYTYDPGTEKIVNQYPPGAALLLSCLPRDWRGVLYPALVIGPLCLLPLLLWRRKGLDLLGSGLVMLCVPALCIWLDPMNSQLRMLGSVGPTFAILVLAGMVIRKSPHIALVLLATSCLFRVANVWLMPIFALPLLFKEYFEDGRRTGLRTLVVRGLGSLRTAFTWGLGWLLLYQWLLLGNPLKSPYGSADKALANWDGFCTNLSFYLGFRNECWFGTHLVLLGLVALLFYAGRCRRTWLLWALLLCLWNYAFFLVHEVRIQYYVYAPAAVLTGLVISRIEFLNTRRRQLLAGAVSIALIALVIALNLRKAPDVPTATLRARIDVFERDLAQADVVWADHYSGTVEYSIGKAGMRIMWAQRDLSHQIMRWLAAKGYTQAILQDDPGCNAEMVMDSVNTSGLTFRVEETPMFGRILWIEPQEVQ